MRAAIRKLQNLWKQLDSAEAELRMTLADIDTLKNRQPTHTGLDLWADIFLATSEKKRDELLAKYPDLKQRIDQPRYSEPPF